jgi:hypothetical protein
MKTISLSAPPCSGWTRYAYLADSEVAEVQDRPAARQRADHAGLRERRLGCEEMFASSGHPERALYIAAADRTSW